MERRNIPLGIWFITAGILMMASSLGIINYFDEKAVALLFIMGGCLIYQDYILHKDEK